MHLIYRSACKHRSRLMGELILRFFKNDSGTTAIEYCLIAVFIALVIVAGANSVGTSLQATFANIAVQLAG
jgi:pilus assembly protein Flp/PilA